MWPHHILVGVGGHSISVGSDDPSVIEDLEPWRIGEARDVVDFGLWLHVEYEPESSGPKQLHALRHGSADLTRSRDSASLKTALWQVLGSFEETERPEELQIRLTPVVNGSSAVLIHPMRLEMVSERQLERSGLKAMHTFWAKADPRTGEVIVSPPLGSTADPARFSLAGIIFGGDTRSRARNVSSLMMCTYAPDDVDPSWMLRSTLTLADSTQVVRANDRQEIESALADLWATTSPSLGAARGRHRK